MGQPHSRGFWAPWRTSGSFPNTRAPMQTESSGPGTDPCSAEPRSRASTQSLLPGGTLRLSSYCETRADSRFRGVTSKSLSSPLQQQRPCWSENLSGLGTIIRGVRTRHSTVSSGKVTYQVFFTKFSELVKFLGHEELGTAHCSSNFP